MLEVVNRPEQCCAAPREHGYQQVCQQGCSAIIMTFLTINTVTTCVQGTMRTIANNLVLSIFLPPD